jgi:hypothetical protein
MFMMYVWKRFCASQLLFVYNCIPCIYIVIEDPIIRWEGRDPIIRWEGRDTIIRQEGRDLIIRWEGRDLIIMQEGRDPIIRWEGRDPIIRWEGRDPIIRWEGRDPINRFNPATVLSVPSHDLYFQHHMLWSFFCLIQCGYHQHLIVM